jgi:tRNA pseudouridine38-40 synthase
MHFRYAVELAYDGTPFHGWQRQPNAISVQETLEKTIQKLHANVEVSVVGCGRTDTGVHASYYVLHVDLIKEIEVSDWVYKLNKMLPESIVVFSIQLVTQEFHARFSAVSRTYKYFVSHTKDPFNLHTLVLPKLPDFDSMNEAALNFLGTKDFTSLSKLHTDVKTNICTVKKALWIKNGDTYFFEIEADRFLRNMVRATVGTLLEVGYGRIAPHEIKHVLDAKNREEAGMSVPAKALFLVDIRYPNELFERYGN